MSLNRGKLGRISAIDPAQPLFQDMPEFVRLDPGDAEFVDVIHTDAKSILMGGMIQHNPAQFPEYDDKAMATWPILAAQIKSILGSVEKHANSILKGYGMESPCGHVDFYPNGGFDQPGCSLFDMPFSLDTMGSNPADMVGRHLVACSHNRGLELYIESLRATSCHMIGHKCDSYEQFQSGLCFDCGQEGKDCAIMGERAIEYKPHVVKASSGAKFFLKTGKKAPFCRKLITNACPRRRPSFAAIFFFSPLLFRISLPPLAEFGSTHGGRAMGAGLHKGQLVRYEKRDHRRGIVTRVSIIIWAACS